MKTMLRAALTLSVAFSLAACDHEHGDHAHEEDVDQVAEGCKHMEFGPEVALEINNAAPPAIETFHTRYDLTLTDAADEAYAGLLDYTSVGGMHYLIFDQAFDFAITDGEGATVEAMMVEADPASCELASVVHHVMLPAGTYRFALDAVPEPLLKMVVHVSGQNHAHE